MKTAALTLIAALALSGCGPVDDELLLEADATALAADDGKADRADLPLRTLDFAVPSSIGQRETRRTFTTASSFRAFFGASAPGVNFGTHWVTYYSAGVKPTGGYKASVERVRLSDSGRTLKVTTRLVSPGPSCIVTQAFTKPHELVVYPRPRPVPTYVAYARNDGTRNCDVSCRNARCAPNHYCYDGDGDVRCIPYTTCANAELACAPGTHCEDQPIQCVRAPCAPTGPVCVADACAVRPYTPTSRELQRAFSNDTRDTDATPKLFARSYTFSGTSVSVADAVAPCPPGATCVWSGIVTAQASYAIAAGKLELRYSPQPSVAHGMAYYKELKVLRDCEGKLVLVEASDDGTGRTRSFR